MITYTGAVEPRAWVTLAIGRPPARRQQVSITIDADDPLVLTGDDLDTIAYIEDYIESITVDDQVSVHAEGEWHPAGSAEAAEYATAQVLALGCDRSGDTYLVEPDDWPG